MGIPGLMWYLGHCRTGCIIWSVLVLPFGKGVTFSQKMQDFGVEENHTSFEHQSESDLVPTFYKNLSYTCLISLP